MLVMKSVLLRNPMLYRFVGFVLLPLSIIAFYIFFAYFLAPLSNNGVGEDDKALILKTGAVIIKDEAGITHISAKTDADVFFATGYAHAQDRMWQLEMQKRFANGSLAQVLGPSLLNNDTWARVFGFYRLAENTFSQLSPQAQTALTQYAAGVNAWISEKHPLPVEYIATGSTPTQWSALDSLAWMNVFAFNLSGNLEAEIQFLLASASLSPDQLTTFFNAKAVNPSISEPLTEVFDANSVESLHALNTLSGAAMNGKPGSNAWVISGKHSLSSLPVLSNDPHLRIQVPSVWYAIKQSGNTLNSQGMSLVGLPIVVFGSNGSIAWGGTNMMADTQDLFLSTPNLHKSLNEGFLNMDIKTRVEEVSIASEFPESLNPQYKNVKLAIRLVDGRPIINQTRAESLSSLAVLDWPPYELPNTTFEAFLNINYASDFSEFDQAASGIVAPVLNLVYADSSDNIAMIGAGRIPIRSKEKGMLPQVRKAPLFGKRKYIPHQQLPRVVNPESGIIVNANNQNHNTDYPFYISDFFAGPARANRIEELLRRKDKFSVEQNNEIYYDEKDLSVVHLLPILIETGQNNGDIYLTALKQWDGTASKQSFHASIYYNLLRHLKEALFDDEIKQIYYQSAHHNSMLRLKDRVTNEQLAELLSSNSQWCDNTNTSSVESCSDIIEKASNESVKELKKWFGTDKIEKWLWGEIQSEVYEHILFSEVKIMNMLSNISNPVGGSVNTVNVSSGYFDSDMGYVKDFGAGFRQTIVFSPDAAAHYFTISSGQSGHLLSPNYSDLHSEFDMGRFRQFKQLDKIKKNSE
ncbi:penicillin acylase family protein [Pseudoalteromonas luteoviolacea]|uniref:penicillin acylase family protein n=1 Tax=Pseudoalteromonas luteoviolacea TaxID=43657 RepID=UPI001F336C9A|nr:penicillin acylase family protein [Pseudoalteromonas luteoviolacea]MCF6442839.1 penicillin acylase family protein [Pseudoalteromonas luteoviolacea]